MITILSATGCSQCHIAKQMLTNKCLEYTEISTNDPEGFTMINQYNVKGLPFILFNDKPVYGVGELVRKLQEVS